MYSYYERLQTAGIQPITYWDDAYSPLLRHSDDPPAVLFARGDSALLHYPLPIAVVGTRRITGYGLMVVRELVRDLVGYSAVIVSGFMYGVDLAAHRAALRAGGKTVAVLGYGVDECYPQRQQRDLEEIVQQGGLVISEFPPGTKPARGNFPLRNRIIAGMSCATLVAEAARKSGSHITAQCALDAGRVVAAVPGPITNPYSQGTQWLINQGAVLVVQASDILEHIVLPDELQARMEQAQAEQMLSADAASQPLPPALLAASPQARRIYGMLRTQPLEPSELAEALNLPISVILAELTQLELCGALAQTDTMWTVV